MITSVSFYIAKLLKEKGFDNLCKYLWHFNGSDCIKMINKNSENFGFSAPTIFEVVMWLYEKHGIWVSVEYMDDILLFCFKVCTIKTNTNEMEQLGFNTPADAYEAAIEYCLVNLIKEENENN